MGSISAGVGLISGINSAQLIDSLIGLEAKSKLPYQKKLTAFSASKTALLDINARLLNLKNAAQTFRKLEVFKSALATSSNEAILTAKASSKVAPGGYSFIVKQLASTSQLLSKGFAATTTPLGLDQLSFEFGKGKLTGDTDLSVLNGGEGVRRGKIVATDKSGKTATIDLSSATTLNEVINVINTASGVSLKASVDGDRLIITDLSGGGGTLSIANASGSFAATDLGIVGSTAGSSIAGTSINKIGLNSSLSALNDGLGVFIRDNATDFKIQIDGTTTYNIDLGRKDAPITADTKLSDLNNGLGVAINSTTDDDFIVKTTSGVSVGVKLGDIKNDDGEVIKDKVTTVGELITRVNAELTETLGANAVVLSLDGDGKNFVLTDNLAGGFTLQVTGAGVNNTKTAENLGLLTTASPANLITGTNIPNTVQTARAATIQDVISRINDQTSGAVTASIAADGVSLRLSATGTISILAGDVDGSSFASTVGNQTAKDLGLLGLSGAGSVSGSRLIAGLNTKLVRNLNGGDGLGSATTLNLTDRSGASFSITNVNTYASLADLITAINSQAVSNNVDINVGINNAGNGLTVTDSSGGTGNLIVGGDASSALGITANVAASTFKGNDLDIQYIGLATSVGDLNYGQGIGTGTFKLTDATGASEDVDIGTDAVSLYDIVQEINSRGLYIEARINDTGDGIVLVDTYVGTPTNAIKVENKSGSVASKLGILGTASDLGESIDGSYEKVVDLATTDNLTNVISKINAAKIPVTASILNTGSGGQPYKIAFLSSILGQDGDLLIDGGNVDLGLTTLTEAKDAKVFFGSTDPANATLLQSSTNSFTNVVNGLTVDLKSASADPTTVTVTRDTSAIISAVNQLVTTFNDVIGRLNLHDSYNVDTKVAGPLLGNSTAARVRQRLYQVAQGKATGVSTAYSTLSQIGIKFDKQGQLVFDQTKFETAYANDPDAVENLFAAFETSTETSKEVSPGITVTTSTENVTKLGFGDLFERLVTELTDSFNGVLTVADQNLQKQIDGTNDRLELLDARLETRKTILQRQFAAMEEALAKLQAQQGSLSSLSSILAAA